MSSIREVAAEAKVSLGTVSKVLNNRSNAQISIATRERVREAARRIGYHPSAIARGLAGMRMNALGVIMAYSESSVTSDYYLGPCLDGILQVCKERQQRAVIFPEGSWEDALDHVPVFCDGHCDGLMLVIPRLDSHIIDALQLRKVPFLLVGDSRETDTLVTVDVDNIGGAQMAVEHLIGLGHRRIAAFMGNPDFCSSTQRLEGYQRALAAAHIPLDPSLLFPGEYLGTLSGSNVRQMLATFPKATRPTALFCFNDNIALAAIAALQEQGVRVPLDMSVIGFDDTPRAAQSFPALTTMRQTTREVGARAATALLDCIEGSAEPGTKVRVPAQLIVRETTRTLGE